MSTPVATIADALFAFIMSLLRDPDAAAEFNAAPQRDADAPTDWTMRARPTSGRSSPWSSTMPAWPVTTGDRRRSTQQQYPPRNPVQHGPGPGVIREISRIVNQFTSIDARSTIVDQSVNQNIWTEGGDVTQIFDQDAVVASGDDAIAAGDDANHHRLRRRHHRRRRLGGQHHQRRQLQHRQLRQQRRSTAASTATTSTPQPSTSTTTDDADADADALAAADAPAESDAPCGRGDRSPGRAVTAAVDAAADAVDVRSTPASTPADLLSADLTRRRTPPTRATRRASCIDEPVVEEPAEEQ